MQLYLKPIVKLELGLLLMPLQSRQADWGSAHSIRINPSCCLSTALDHHTQSYTVTSTVEIKLFVDEFVDHSTLVFISVYCTHKLKFCGKLGGSSKANFAFEDPPRF